jgi:recombination protein U
MANKGRALEELIIYQNELYKSKGIANIQKISTPWKVIRSGKNIISAFPEEKSTVDFRGTVKGGIPVSFDAKESEDINGLLLKYIEPHQIDYIRDAMSLGEKSFILCSINPLGKRYIIPGVVVLEYWDRWQANKGKRGYNTIPTEAMRIIKQSHNGYVCDYLPVAFGK